MATINNYGIVNVFIIFYFCQVLQVLRFVQTFIDENPLCCCSEEISNIKKKLIAGSDELKLRQKSSSVVLIVREGGYRIRYNISVPQDYPDTCVR